MTKDIANRMDGSFKNIERVVRTESVYERNEAQAQAYEDFDYEYYEFSSHTEGRSSERTCANCNALDGRTYKFKERIVGVNFPPLHPNCRCTVITYMSDIIILQEDREDFEKFKNVGISVPDNIEDFVEIKYNDDKVAWEDLQMKYERKTEYNLQIRQGKQNHHIKGRNGYTNKSYLLEGIDAKKLVDNFGGKGKLKRTIAGELTDKEFCEVDFIIGVVVDKETGEETETNRFSISYSKKKGTHVVPRNKEKGEKND